MADIQPADLESKVLDIIAAQARADRPSMTRDTPLATLELDSMDFIEIVFEMEEAFDVSIPYSANAPETGGTAFQTAGDVIDMVSKIVAESAKP